MHHRLLATKIVLQLVNKYKYINEIAPVTEFTFIYFEEVANAAQNKKQISKSN